MATYFRFPDQLVLVTDNHEVTGKSEFTLTIKGTVHDFAEAGGKIFWLLDPNLSQMEPHDLILKKINERLNHFPTVFLLIDGSAIDGSAIDGSSTPTTISNSASFS